MTNCRNIIFALLLVCSLFGNTFAQTYPWYNYKTSTNNTKMEIDSVDFYNNLIAQEDSNAKYNANVVGMVFGGILTGIGIISFIRAEQMAHHDTDKSKSKKDQFAEGLGYSLASGLATVKGTIFTLIGLPIFIYNISKYSVHKRHAENRDAYQKSLDQYLENKHSMQLIVAPAVNLLSGGGGINAVLQF